MSFRKICRAIPNVQETLEVASNDAELMVQDRGGILEKMITVSIYIIGILLVYYWYIIDIWLYYYYHDMIYIIEIIIIMIIVPLGEYILINRSSS